MSAATHKVADATSEVAEDVLIDELRSLRAEIATLTAYVRGRKTGPYVSTAEAAVMMGTTPRVFRALYVGAGRVKPINGHKCKFHRRDIERLRDRNFASDRG